VKAGAGPRLGAAVLGLFWLVRIIPVTKSCLGVLLKDGMKVLKMVERQGGVKIARGGDTVTVEGEPASEWAAQNVLEALSLGFPPKRALKLFGDDFFLETIDMRAALRGKDVARCKARIIGTHGKAKRTLEELSGASIAVGEDRVEILGRFDEIQLAREGILRILEGHQHSTVYAFLERRARESARAGLR
jgi:ribosomal RNA assembly protein